jgi:hypothetical protein
MKQSCLVSLVTMALLGAAMAGCGGGDDDGRASVGGAGGEATQVGGAGGEATQVGGAGGTTVNAGGAGGEVVQVGGAGGVATQALVIIGSYTDDWATVHAITDTTWTQSSSFGTSVFAITQYYNAAEFLIAQNASTNDYNPDLWSRFDWTTYQGSLWFCQTSYDAATEAAALAAARPNDADPTAQGSCGTFAWSPLTPAGVGAGGAGGAATAGAGGVGG